MIASAALAIATIDPASSRIDWIMGSTCTYLLFVTLVDRHR